MPDTLDKVLEAIEEGLTSVHESVKHGDKAVTYRSIAELRESVKLARELNEKPQTLVVAVPRRPRL